MAEERAKSECKTCRSYIVYLVDGLYYCKVCDMQREHARQEQTDEDYLSMGYMREVTETKKRKKRVPTTGIPWTTTGAFNQILSKQVRVLVEKAGVPAVPLRQMVAVIWASYLEASELAFVDNEREGPRLHAAARFRDIQRIGYHKETIPFYRVNAALSPEQKGKKRLRFGKSVLSLSLREDTPRSKQQSSRTCPKQEEPSDRKFINSEVKQQILRMFRDLDLNHSMNYLFNSSGVKRGEEFLSKELVSDSDSNSDTDVMDDMDDGLKLNKSINWTKLSPEVQSRVVATTPIITRTVSATNLTIDSEEAEGSLNGDILQKLKYSTRSEAYLNHSGLPKNYWKSRNSYPANDCFVDLMTMSKTVAIINLALRLMNSGVHSTDLIAWVNEGHIPYFDGTRHLPDEWEIQQYDVQTFTATAAPSPFALNTLTYKIASFIGLYQFIPTPDLFVLIERYVVDLNLPLALLELMSTEPSIKETIRKLSTLVHKSVGLPYYERYAFMFIIVVLKKLFVLNEKTEKDTSELLRLRGDTKAFIWDDWEHYTRLRMASMKAHYIPLHRQKVNEMVDVKVIHDFSLQVATNWKPKAATTFFPPSSYSQTRNEIQREMYNMGPEECLIQFPQPSLYHLTRGTDFALSRTEDERRRAILSQDFRGMSLLYLGPDSEFTFRYQKFKRSKTGKMLADQISAPVTMLLELSQWLLFSEPCVSYKVLLTVEKYLFPCSYRKSRRRRSTRR